MDNFELAVREAEAIYLNRADVLQEAFAVSESDIRNWLKQVQHWWNGRYYSNYTYARAFGKKQWVCYNPKIMINMEYVEVLDTVLHELGHLFTHFFLQVGGHGWEWKKVGELVGYTPIGSTDLGTRKKHPHYALYVGHFVTGKFLSEVSYEAPPVKPKEKHTISRTDRPVDVVRRLFLEFREEIKYGMMTRREFLDYCEDAGVSPNTASTQYSRFKKELL